MLEQHIEELRAELRNAVIRKDRRWIEAELKRALAGLDARLDEVERELREINHADEAPPSSEAPPAQCSGGRPDRPAGLPLRLLSCRRHPGP